MANRLRGVIETTIYGAEPVMDALLACGVKDYGIFDAAELGVETENDELTRELYIVFYVDADDDGRACFGRVGKRLENLLKKQFEMTIGTLALTCADTGDDVWQREWSGWFGPVRAGRAVIVPEWEAYVPQPEDIVIRIASGSAFGDGRHPSTRGSAEALQLYMKPGDRLLDIGCGSGVLSVLGLMLGAEAVMACDIDEEEINATTTNAQANLCDTQRLSMYEGDIIADAGLRDKLGGPFDVVVSNIYADVLIELAPIVKGFLKPGGYWVSAGITTELASNVRGAYAEHGFTVMQEIDINGWITMAAR